MVGERVMARYPWVLPPCVVDIVTAFLMSLLLTLLIDLFLGSPTMGVQVWTGKDLISLLIVGILVLGSVASGLLDDMGFLRVCCLLEQNDG